MVADLSPPSAGAFDPSTARPDLEDAPSSFDPSTAKPEVASTEFDSSTARPDLSVEPRATISAAPEEGFLHKAYRTAREALSPVLGPTGEQQAQREQEKRNLERQFPQIAQAAEGASEKVETQGFTPALFGIHTPWSLPVNEGEPVREKSNPYFEALLAPSEKSDPTSLKVAQALYTPIAKTINALTSPVSLGTMGIGAGATAITKAGGEGIELLHGVERGVAAIFATDMGRGVAEALPDAVAKINNPDVDFKDKLQAGVELALNASLAGLAGVGAYRGVAPAEVAGKSPVEQVKILSEASGKSLDEVAADAHSNFEELIGKGEGEKPAAATTTFDPSTAEPDLSPQYRYEIWKHPEEKINVTKYVEHPTEGRISESKSLEDWLNQGEELAIPHEDIGQGNFSHEEVLEMNREKEALDQQDQEHVERADQVLRQAGLGPARAEEFEPTPTRTSIKNEWVDQDRVQRGLPPVMEEAKRGFGKVWNRAMQEIDRNPDIADEIVGRQLEKPEPLTDEQDAILLHRKIDLENDFDKVMQRITNDEGSEVTRASDRNTMLSLQDKLEDLYDAMKAGGRETARGLNARKMVAKEDYSLAKMIMRKRAELDGRELTPKEESEVVKAHKRIKQAREELAQKEEADAKKAGEEGVENTIEQSKKKIEAEGKTPKKIDFAKEEEKAVAGIKKAGADPEDIRGFIQRLAENFVRQGVTEREPLIDAVHGVVKKALPEFTRRQTMDAISGYGDFKPLNPDAVKAQLRDLKGQMQQVGKLEDMQKGQAPAKTGVERRTPSDEERRLIKQVNEMKRRGGFTVTDPAKQLKSALEAIKTRLRNSISDLEHQIETKTRIVRDETPAPSDAEVEGLRKQRDLLKEEFDRIFKKPDLTDAERIKLAEKSADRQIAELERQLRTGELFPKGEKPEVTSPALEAKRARIEALKEEREYARKTIQSGEEPRTETEKKAAALDRQIAELEKQIRNREVFSKTKKAPEDEPELASRRARLEELRKEREYLREEISPQARKTRDEINLAALKTRLKNRLADLQERLANQDFEPRKRPEPVRRDPEAEALEAEVTRAKREFDTALLKDRLANRTILQKMKDTFVKWRRGFLLSSPVTLAKLSAAAAHRMLITPAEEVVGAAIGKAIPGVAERAPREGGLNIRAEARAITQAMTQGMKDAWQTLRTGQSDLDLNYGRGRDSAVRESDIVPRTFIDFFGSVHGALKAPVKRAEFARSFEKRTAFNLRNGVDMSDPAVQVRTAIEAYKDAEKAIFLQDNRLVDMLNTALARLQAPDKATGEIPASATVTAGVFRTLFPIVRVPTNIVAELAQYVFGAVTGSARLAQAYGRGIESLKPAQADLIMRELKKGSIGTATLLLGYFGANAIGGFYQNNQRQKPGQPKAGTVKVFGEQVPRQLLESPQLQALQVGATVRRVAEQRIKGDEQGLGTGTWAAALGLVSEIPFAKEATQFSELLDARERQQATGELVKSIVVPAGVSAVAEATDRNEKGPIPRKPKTVLQHVEAGIPGLRQSVPEDFRKENRNQ